MDYGNKVPHTDARGQKVSCGDYITVHGSNGIGQILWLHTESNRATVQWFGGTRRSSFLGHMLKVEIEDVI